MRVLVLGGTGAMGSRLCPLLAQRGDDVVVTSRRRHAPAERMTYVMGDAKDSAFLGALLEERWDSVVDFMTWPTANFGERVHALLASAGQYVFLSSYRVYADSALIDESSPRILDTCEDETYLATDEYALAKARCEDMLARSGMGNWTIVRPAITYDGAVGRLQLGTYEARDWLWRALNGVPVPLPEGMLERQTTMTWGGDVAHMLARLVGNEQALGETYTASTSESMGWRDVARMYQNVLPELRVVPCGLDDFIRAKGGEAQIRLDRMVDRRVDNSKVLRATGMTQGELLPMCDGLEAQLSECLRLGSAGLGVPARRLHARLDRLCGSPSSLCPLARQAGWMGTLPLYAAGWLL